MRPRSNISSSLGHRRRKHLLYKGLLWFFVVVVFVGLLAFWSNNSWFKVEEISVSGNTSISDVDVKDVVSRALSEKYLGIFSKNNYLFAPTSNIEKSISYNIKRVESARVRFVGLRKIEVNIKERLEYALWCKGKPAIPEDCYFLDKTGYIFDSAPNFSGNLYIKYYGLIAGEPVGQNYFDEKTFIDISDFLNAVDKMGFAPDSFLAVNGEEYEVGLSLGGKIALNNKDGLGEELRRLQSLVTDGIIKTDNEFLGKLNHIDLRYGNKVHFDFR
jgi:hypothetical protein